MPTSRPPILLPPLGLNDGTGGPVPGPTTPIPIPTGNCDPAPNAGVASGCWEVTTVADGTVRFYTDDGQYWKQNSNPTSLPSDSFVRVVSGTAYAYSVDAGGHLQRLFPPNAASNGAGAVWQQNTGRKMSGHPLAVDNEGIVYMGWLDGFVTLHSHASGAQTGSYDHGTPITSVTVDPAGTWVAIGDIDGVIVRLALPGLTVDWTANEHTARVNGLCNDGATIYSASWDRTAKAFDVTTGGRVWTYTNESEVNDIDVNGALQLVDMRGLLTELDTSGANASTEPTATVYSDHEGYPIYGLWIT